MKSKFAKICLVLIALSIIVAVGVVAASAGDYTVDVNYSGRGSYEVRTYEQEEAAAFSDIWHGKILLEEDELLYQIVCTPAENYRLSSITVTDADGSPIVSHNGLFIKKIADTARATVTFTKINAISGVSMTQETYVYGEEPVAVGTVKVTHDGEDVTAKTHYVAYYTDSEGTPLDAAPMELGEYFYVVEVEYGDYACKEAIPFSIVKAEQNITVETEQNIQCALEELEIMFQADREHTSVVEIVFVEDEDADELMTGSTLLKSENPAEKEGVFALLLTGEVGTFQVDVTFAETEHYNGKTVRITVTVSHHPVKIFGHVSGRKEAGYKPCFYCEDCATYFVDEDCTKPIGDSEAYSAWTSEGGEGYLPPHAPARSASVIVLIVSIITAIISLIFKH